MIKSNPQAMTITRQEVEELIERIADETSCDMCRGNKVLPDCSGKELKWTDKPCWYCEVKGFHSEPILIGDVLDRVDTFKLGWTMDTGEIMFKWQPCGFAKSLQEIVATMEWVTPVNKSPLDATLEELMIMGIPQAKPSPATDLFEFLLSLNLKP